MITSSEKLKRTHQEFITSRNNCLRDREGPLYNLATQTALSVLTIPTSTPDGASEVSGSTVTPVSLDKQVRNATEELKATREEFTTSYNNTLRNREGPLYDLALRLGGPVDPSATPLRTEAKTA